MLDYFQYDFFTNALIALVLASLSAGVIGTYIITRRLVSIAGGITHACFGGLGLGYFLGVSPLLTAGVFAVGSAGAVEWASRRWNVRQDSATAVVWSVGMALGVVFVFLTPGFVPELNSFLFGNILTVGRGDILASAVFTAVLALVVALFYRRIVAVSFDADFAQVLGIDTRQISYTMTVLTAIGIVLIIRLVGIMLLMSVLSLPMMAAETFCRRFHTIMFASAAIAAVAGVGGLFLSTVIEVPCSALIVIILAAMFGICRLLFRR